MNKIIREKDVNIEAELFLWRNKEKLASIPQTGEAKDYKYHTKKDIDTVVIPLLNEAGIFYYINTDAISVSSGTEVYVEAVLAKQDDDDLSPLKTVEISNIIDRPYPNLNLAQTISFALTFFKRVALLQLFDITTNEDANIETKSETHNKERIIDGSKKAKDLYDSNLTLEEIKDKYLISSGFEKQLKNRFKNA